MEEYRDKIKDEYFNWLYMLVGSDRVHENMSYRKLFSLLHDITFDFYIRNDINRARDGEELRFVFASRKTDIDEEINTIKNILNDRPCSVLEMIVALAMRCEDIMDNTEYGDRTGVWFWNMLNNIGISGMFDECFDEKRACEAIFRFMERQYEPNGRGGLFYIRDYIGDLTEVEIWTQLCWYLESFD